MKTKLRLSKLAVLGLLLVLALLPACWASTVSGPPLPTRTPETSLPPTISGDGQPSPLPDSQATANGSQPGGNTPQPPRANPTISIYLPSINEGDEQPAPSETQSTVPVPSTGDNREPAPAADPQTSIYLPVVQDQQDTGPFRFVAWGDTKTGTETLAALSNQAKLFNPAFTLYLGDLEGDGFTLNGITAWTNAINGGNGSGMSAITLPVRGNHDNLDLPGWQSYFDTAGVVQRIGGQNFTELEEDISYAFEYKNAVFIALDVLGNGDLPSDSELAYLDSTLTAAEQRGLEHAFITMHGPVYHVSKHNDCLGRTCTTPGSVASFVRVLNNHPIVSAVFNGHEHLYAYVHMDATRIPEIVRPWEQFIAGAAGAGLYPCDQDYRFDYCGGYDGFVTVDVDGKTYTVTMYQLNNPTPVQIYTFTKD